MQLSKEKEIICRRIKNILINSYNESICCEETYKHISRFLKDNLGRIGLDYVSRVNYIKTRDRANRLRNETIVLRKERNKYALALKLMNLEVDEILGSNRIHNFNLICSHCQKELRLLELQNGEIGVKMWGTTK